MENENELVIIFTGSEIEVNLLKAELEEEGIPSLIKNDFQMGLSAGFVAGIPSAIDLLVNESDKRRAEIIAKDFLQD